jgi:hypothetical protein
MADDAPPISGLPEIGTQNAQVGQLAGTMIFEYLDDGHPPGRYTLQIVGLKAASRA